MLDKMTLIEASGSWELVDSPPCTQPIVLKRVYNTPKDADGIVTKHKAWLIAKGHVQHQGVNFDEYCRLSRVNIGSSTKSAG